MDIDLRVWAAFEQEFSTSQYTQHVIAEAIATYLKTPEHQSEDLEDLMPVYRALEKLGIVSDIPELVVLDDEDDDEEGFEENDDEEEEEK